MVKKRKQWKKNWKKNKLHRGWIKNDEKKAEKS
jgi:hypothetical protein